MTSEGTVWKDPSGYFEQLVYPGYVDAHRDIFTVGILQHLCPSMRSQKCTEWQCGAGFIVTPGARAYRAFTDEYG
jgi:hypothetical protein